MQLSATPRCLTLSASTVYDKDGIRLRWYKVEIVHVHDIITVTTLPLSCAQSFSISCAQSFSISCAQSFSISCAHNHFQSAVHNHFQSAVHNHFQDLIYNSLFSCHRSLHQVNPSLFWIHYHITEAFCISKH